MYLHAWEMAAVKGRGAGEGGGERAGIHAVLPSPPLFSILVRAQIHARARLPA